MSVILAYNDGENQSKKEFSSASTLYLQQYLKLAISEQMQKQDETYLLQ